jgi:type VI secretion system protein ImpL
MKNLFKRKSNTLTDEIVTPETKEALHHFAAHYQQAETFLKTRPSQHDKSLANLPRILVLGETGAGKTSLLAHSGIPFIFSKTFSLHQLPALPPTSYCDWWVSSKRAYLDLSGEIFEAKQPLTQALWKKLLSLLKKSTSPLQGVILTIDAQTLLHTDNETKLNHLLTKFENALKTLDALSKNPLPVYIVLTKLDYMYGFREFFNELNENERKQVWGFNLENPLDIGLSTLMKRLHEHTITYLHHEHQLEKRARIKDFPLMMEKFKPDLQNMLINLQKRLTPLSKIQLKEFFFCSSLQKEIPLETLQKTSRTADTFALMIPNLKPIQSSKAYFCFDFLDKQLDTINHTLEKTKQISHMKRNAHLRKGILFSASLLMLWISVSFAYSFKKNIQHITQVEGYLARYEILKSNLNTKKNPSLEKTLSVIAPIEQANHLLNDLQLPWFFKRTHLALQTIKTKTQQLYDNLLLTSLAPKLSETLVDKLSTETEPTALYGVLKAYQLFSSSTHQDLPYLQSWFEHTLTNLSSQEKISLEHELTHLLNNLKYRQDNKKQNLIWQAQRKLHDTDKALLAYAIIKNQAINQTELPLTEAQITNLQRAFNFNPAQLRISKIFTENGYETLYNNALQNSITASEQGDWVTGTYPKNTLEITPRDPLEKQIATIYLADYHHTWEKISQAFTLKPTKTFAEHIELLKILSQKNSPLNDYLDMISNNTHIVGEFLLPQFNHLNETNHDSPPLLTDLNDGLTSLYTDLSNIDNSNDAAETSFDYVKNRFMHFSNPADQTEKSADPLTLLTNLAPQLPMPLQTWLTHLTQASWDPLIEQAQTYLKMKWQTEVFSIYEKDLMNRYPLEASATNEIDLHDFSQFFSQNGILDTFYQTYLQPFIQNYQDHWSWQKVDGKSIELSDAFLSQIRRGLIIKSMFFQGDNTTFNIPFKLKSVSLEPIVKWVSLTIGNQTLKFTQQSVADLSSTWPDKNNQTSVDLTFHAITGKESHLHLDGKWALFRLLSRANLAPTADPRTFDLTLDLNGNAAQMQLLADSDMNPFIPHILEGFNLNSAVKP